MEIKVNKCVIPRTTPFVTSQASQDTVNAVIIQVSDGEYMGVGETCPRSHINGETLDSSFNQVVTWAQSVEVGDSITPFFFDPGYTQLGASTAMGIESALFDLRARQIGVPLHHLMNDQQRDRVSYAGFIGANVKGENLNGG